jgi:hypothetical protein
MMLQNLHPVVKHRIHTRLRVEYKGWGFPTFYTFTRIASRNPKSKTMKKKLYMAIVAMKRNLPQHYSVPVGEGRRIFIIHDCSPLQHVAKEPQLRHSKLHHWRRQNGGRSKSWDCPIGTEDSPGSMVRRDDELCCRQPPRWHVHLFVHDGQTQYMVLQVRIHPQVRPPLPSATAILWRIFGLDLTCWDLGW